MEYIGYHGTDEKFESFDLSKSGYIGFYFSPDKNHYVINRRKYIITARLIIDNPAPSDIVRKIYDESGSGNPRKIAHEKLKSMGYDGIIRPIEYVVFNPEQIKIMSVEENKNTSKTGEIITESSKPFVNFLRTLKRPGNETLIEAILEGYNVIFEDQIKGGKADKKKPSDFDPEELKMGIEIEQEHTNDKKLAQEIATDHLTEFPNYYTELKNMEKKLEKNLNEAIGPVYHGTNAKFEKFDLNKTTMGDIWFNSNRKTIEQGESGASGTKYIMERYLNIPEEKLAGWDLYDRYSLGQLVNMGYKGVKLPSEDGTNYIVFDPKDIRNKP